MSHDEDQQDDLSLFRREIGEIKPLKSQARVVHETPRPSPRPRQLEKDERAVLDELLDPVDPQDGLETGEELAWLRTGYQRRYLSRLRRGHYTVRDVLDLHGLNEETASEHLAMFISQSARMGLGCVRVIHGKGLRSRERPVLKQLTNRLLRRHPAVIAFASCRPVDGGTGAAVVLLRNK